MLVVKKGEPCAPGEYSYYAEESLPPNKIVPQRRYDAMLALRDREYPELEMAIRVPIIVVCRMNIPHTPTFRVITFAHTDNHGNPELPHITSQITEEGHLKPTEAIKYQELRIPTGYFLPHRPEED